MIPQRLWTIGHSNHSADVFVSLLQMHHIEAVADVRLLPGSRRHPHFNSGTLAQTLARSAIVYVHFRELGGRRKSQPDSPNTAWRNASFRGYADYMDTDAFRSGIERLEQLAGEKRTVIICAEALWWQCHRGLISDYEKARGVEVLHILSNGKIEGHPFTSAAQIIGGQLSYRAPRADATQPELW